MTLICGVPNAGKTTHSKKVSPSYHSEDFFQGNFEEQFVKCNEFLSTLEEDFYVEGVYNTVDLRKALLEACKDQPYKRCIYREISLESCLKRENRHRHPFVLRQAYSILEPPTLDEGWDEIITIHEDGTETVQKRNNLWHTTNQSNQ